MSLTVKASAGTAGLLLSLHLRGTWRGTIWRWLLRSPSLWLSPHLLMPDTFHVWGWLPELKVMMKEAEILRESKAEEWEYDPCRASFSSAVIECPSQCFMFSLFPEVFLAGSRCNSAPRQSAWSRLSVPKCVRFPCWLKQLLTVCVVVTVLWSGIRGLWLGVVDPSSQRLSEADLRLVLSFQETLSSDLQDHISTL